MSQINLALIGCGSIAKKHITAIQAVADAKIVAVCDMDKDIAAKVGNEYGLPFYTNSHEMSKKEKIDIYVILTPSGIHSENILDLVSYGKHFIVEKPLTLRLTEADEIIKACDTVGSKLFVVQQNRFNPSIVKLKEALESGRFGKPVMATARVRWCRKEEYYNAKKWRGTWAYDGGVLANQANHHVDMLTWLMGDVESVNAMSATQLANIEAEDTIVVIMRFVNGALGVLEATTATRPKDLEGSISVLGEKGSVEIGGFFINQLKTWSFEESIPEDETIFEKYGENPKEFAWNHKEFYKNIIQSINEGKKGLIDGLEGRKSLELINAIYESVETGKEIRLRFKPKFTRLGVKENNF